MGLSERLVKQRKKRGLVTQRKGYKLRQATHKFGQKQLKQGTHPQMWRAGGPGSRLGPMGELGDDVIIEIFLKPKAQQLVNATREISMRKIKTGIKQTIYNPLEKYLYGRIDLDVPSDTENLRKQIKGRINDAIITIDQISTTSPFRVVLGTPNVPYAGPVNRMPTSWLQHTSGTGRQGDPLNDPNAKKGWYNLTLLNGRNRAMRLYKDFIRNDIVPMLRTVKALGAAPSAVARAMFKVKFK